MPQPAHLDPSAYQADGGPVGVLLIHGFTGSVAETRPMGEYLAARGMTVRCPLLPGHGTTPEDLIQVRWQAWADEVESAYRELRGRCDSVFVGGLSMGAVLALWLGVAHPEIAGLIAMAPGVKLQTRLLPLMPVVRRVLRYDPRGGIGDDDLGDPEGKARIWCYDETPLWGAGELFHLQRRVNRSLADIHQPILIIQGRRDAVVDVRAPEFLYDAISSVDKEILWLENSGHNLLVDGEREFVWQRSYTWMMERSTAPAGK